LSFASLAPTIQDRTVFSTFLAERFGWEYGGIPDDRPISKDPFGTA